MKKKLTGFVSFLIALLLAAITSSPDPLDVWQVGEGLGTGQQPMQSTATPAPYGQSGDWTLIFNDEFNGVLPNGTGLDTRKWVTCYWYAEYDGSRGCGDNGAQSWYMPQNVVVKNGSLHLITKQETVFGADGEMYHYTSGLVTSGRVGWSGPPKFQYRYGYVEIRAKVPGTKGFWPAFWSLVQAPDYALHPLPEIDTMEILTRDPQTMYMTYHGPNDTTTPSTEYTLPANRLDFSLDYHIFASEWQPGRISWYVDGVERKRYVDRWITDIPMYLLLTMSVGREESWAGGPDGSTRFPSVYEIDYVRVWQRASTARPTPTLFYFPRLSKSVPSN